jgi:anaerobic ribonucleoside-triphosphate reductase activating protein
MTEGYETDVESVLAMCLKLAPDADGVTISGGEPFEQPEGLRELLLGFARWRKVSRRPFDMLGYSGLTFSRLRRDFGGIVSLFDALIPEPFREDRPLGGCWRGSDNQPLIVLSALGRERYRHFVEAHTGNKGGFQVGVDQQAIWLIGLPDRGDMRRLEALVREQGLIFKGVSW